MMNNVTEAVTYSFLVEKITGGVIVIPAIVLSTLLLVQQVYFCIQSDKDTDLYDAYPMLFTNLAVANLSVLIFAAFPLYLTYYYKHLNATTGSCMLLIFLRTASKTANYLFITLVVAVGYYRTSGTNPRKVYTFTWITCVSIWIISSIAAYPHLIATRAEEVDGVYYCEFVVPSGKIITFAFEDGIQVLSFIYSSLYSFRLCGVIDGNSEHSTPAKKQNVQSVTENSESASQSKEQNSSAKKNPSGEINPPELQKPSKVTFHVEGKKGKTMRRQSSISTQKSDVNSKSKGKKGKGMNEEPIAEKPENTAVNPKSKGKKGKEINQEPIAEKPEKTAVNPKSKGKKAKGIHRESSTEKLAEAQPLLGSEAQPKTTESESDISKVSNLAQSIIQIYCVHLITALPLLIYLCVVAFTDYAKKEWFTSLYSRLCFLYYVGIEVIAVIIITTTKN